MRRDVLRILDDMASRTPLEIRATFEGPIETTLDGELSDHVLAAVREAVSNVVRHAGATRADVRISANSDLVLSVTDDGIRTRQQPRSGLENLQGRARELGGDLWIESPADAGAKVVWCVPLDGG